MFTFTTTHSSPIGVTIDGQSFEIPRFLQPELAKWVELQERRIIDSAMAQLDDKSLRARFLLTYQPIPVDLLDALDRTRTPEGVEYVLRTSLKAGGAPDELIERFIKYADPVDKAVLVKKLTETDVASPVIESLAGNEPQEQTSDPLSSASVEPNATSSDAQSTGEASTPAFDSPTAESTAAA